MSFFEVDRHHKDSGNTKVGLIEAPDNGAALRMLRESGLSTSDRDLDSGTTSVKYTLTHPLGGWPSAEAAREDRRTYNEAYRLEQGRVFGDGAILAGLAPENLAVLSAADLLALAQTDRREA